MVIFHSYVTVYQRVIGWWLSRTSHQSNEVDHPVVTTTPHHRRPVHKIAKHLDREMIGMGWSLGPDAPTCSILNMFKQLTSTTLMKIVSEKWLEDLRFPMFCSCNSFVGKSEPAKDLDLWCVLQKRRAGWHFIILYIKQIQQEFLLKNLTWSSTQRKRDQKDRKWTQGLKHMTWKYVIHCNANNCTYRHIYIYTYIWPSGADVCPKCNKVSLGIEFFWGLLRIDLRLFLGLFGGGLDFLSVGAGVFI